MLKGCFAVTLLWFGLFPGVGHAGAEEAHPAVEWSRDYGSDSEGQSVIPTSDGGYLALGGIEDADLPGGYAYQKAYILKLDVNGQVMWERRLQHNTTRNTAYRAIETKEGGYFVIGSSTSNGEPLDQLYAIKLDSAGNVLWEKIQEDDGIHSFPKNVIETDDGSFVIAGEGIVSWLAYEQGYILKLDSNGNTQWYNKYRFTGNGDYLNDLIPATDGGFIAVGHAGEVEYESKEQDALLIMKIDDEGNVVWSKPWVDPQSGWTAYSIVAAEDGGYAVLSRKSIDNKDVTLLSKIDLSGQMQWQKTYRDGTNTESYPCLVRTKEGYAMLGSQRSSNSLNESKTQYAVLRVDVNGDLLSRELFKGPPIVSVGMAAVTSDGGFIFPGTILRGDVRKFQLMKLSPASDGQPAERLLTGISFAVNEKKLKAGTNTSTVLQAVYSDGTKSDLSSAAVYRSEDNSIADIDGLGWISGHKPGQTHVEADYAGFTARLNITVVAEDTDEFDPVDGSLRLDSGEYSVSEGSQLDIKVLLYDYSTQMQTDITKLAVFSSDRPDIAAVDEEGNLIGHKAGMTRINAKYKGSSVYANVQVVRVNPQAIESVRNTDEPES
ncbi:hypothetical protein CJP46_07085 [Paenibacillus sp. XY044]|nr:hypothetical protein CJP46_07085 [Paenibacillus sp. XY044]